MGKYEQLKEVIQKANPDKWNEKCLHCLSRPIRLADVLLVGENILTEAGIYTKDAYYDYFGQIVERWNLRDDNLDHQSDETKQFLIELLVK